MPVTKVWIDLLEFDPIKLMIIWHSMLYYMIVHNYNFYMCLSSVCQWCFGLSWRKRNIPRCARLAKLWLRLYIQRLSKSMTWQIPFSVTLRMLFMVLHAHRHYTGYFAMHIQCLYLTTHQRFYPLSHIYACHIMYCSWEVWECIICECIK